MNIKKPFICWLIMLFCILGCFFVFSNKNVEAVQKNNEANNVSKKINEQDQQKVAQLINSFIGKLYSDKPFTQEDEIDYFSTANIMSMCLLEQLKDDGDEFLRKIVKQNKISLFGEYLRFSKNVLIPQISENLEKGIWINLIASTSSYELKVLPNEIDWSKQPCISNELITVSVTITSGANSPYYFDLSANDKNRRKMWLMDVSYNENRKFTIRSALFIVNGQSLIPLLEFKEKHDAYFHFIPKKRWENFKKWLKNNAVAYGIEENNQLKVQK